MYFRWIVCFGDRVVLLVGVEVEVYVVGALDGAGDGLSVGCAVGLPVTHFCVGVCVGAVDGSVVGTEVLNPRDVIRRLVIVTSALFVVIQIGTVCPIYKLCSLHYPYP